MFYVCKMKNKLAAPMPKLFLTPPQTGHRLKDAQNNTIKTLESINSKLCKNVGQTNHIFQRHLQRLTTTYDCITLNNF